MAKLSDVTDVLMTALMLLRWNEALLDKKAFVSVGWSSRAARSHTSLCRGVAIIILQIYEDNDGWGCVSR